MLRELPLEINSIPSERKFEPFGCVYLLAIYSVSVGGLLAFEVGGRQSISGAQAIGLTLIDIGIVTLYLWLISKRNDQSDYGVRKFWLRLDENGLTICPPKERRPRFVSWDEMRILSIESMNTQGQVERWVTLWGEGDTILAQWTGAWHFHAPRETEIEEYIQYRLSAGQSEDIEHNRAARLWRVNHPLISPLPGHEETIFQMKSRVMEEEFAAAIGCVLYIVVYLIIGRWGVETVFLLLIFGGIGSVALLLSRPTLRVSSHQIEIRFGQQHSQMVWNDVKTIKIDQTGRKLVFEGHTQTLVYPGPTYWNRAKRRDLFFQLIALSDQHRIPLETQALTDLPAYTHQPKEVPLFKRKFYFGKKR